MRFRSLLALSFLPAAVVACDLTGPQYEEVVLRPEVHSAEFDADQSFARLVIDLRIENAGPEPVEYRSCSSHVERLVDGEWVPIWTLACLLQSSVVPNVIIPPGESLEDRIQVGRGAGGDTGWSLPLDGYYRVVAGLVSGPAEIPEWVRWTDPFPVDFD